MADDNKTINPNNVTTGSPVDGGCVYVNFSDTPTLPDTAAEDITSKSDWENVGEISENGYTKSTSTNEQKFKGWHGSTLHAEITDEENTFKIEFTEVVRQSVIKLRYGKDALKLTSTELSGIDPTTVPRQEVAIVVDELLSNGTKMRTVFPRATISSIDDEAHQKGSLLVYGMTFTANVDDKGRPYYVRFAKPKAQGTGVGVA